MKHFLILISLISSLIVIAQTKQKKQSKTESSKGKTHIPASKTLIGIWKQTGVRNPNDGVVYGIKSGNYTVINPDGTYYTFVTWNMQNTSIGQYGSYTVTSDSMMVEHIVHHLLVANLNGKDCSVRYKFLDENTVMLAYSFDKETWVDEQWTRLPLLEQAPTSHTTSITMSMLK